MIPHGTASKYTNHGCRCRPCTDASNAVNKQKRREAKLRLAEDPGLAMHGTRHAYIYWGCRCESCRKANADYERNRRAAAHAP